MTDLVLQNTIANASKLANGLLLNTEIPELRLNRGKFAELALKKWNSHIPDQNEIDRDNYNKYTKYLSKIRLLLQRSSLSDNEKKQLISMKTEIEEELSLLPPCTKKIRFNDKLKHVRWRIDMHPCHCETSYNKIAYSQKTRSAKKYMVERSYKSRT